MAEMFPIYNVMYWLRSKHKRNRGRHTMVCNLERQKLKRMPDSQTIPSLLKLPTVLFDPPAPVVDGTSLPHRL